MSEEKNIDDFVEGKVEAVSVGGYEHFRFVADPGQTPIRIDKFLMDRLEKASRNRIQNAIKAGAVLVNEKPVKPNFKVKPGHLVTIVLSHPPKEGVALVPQEMDLDIRYEDDDLMILHKPPGLVVHPGIGVHDGTLVNGLAHYFNNLNLPIMEGNLANRPGLVHRIDKNTSGLLVIAKNKEAMTHLAKQFFDHSIKRTYQALIWGEFDEKEGTIEAYVGRNPKNHKEIMVFRDGERGKHAITHYKVLEGMYYVSLIECRLETGRTHQIRVHMKSEGHPLFNDDRYGGDRVVKGTVFSKYKTFVQNCFKIIPRHVLHAKSLGFIHPKTGEEMFFESELPDDFQQVLEKWRKYLSGRKNILG